MRFQILGLCGLALIMLGLLFQSNFESQKSESRLVFPNLKAQLAGLETVEIINLNEERVSIVKKESGWVLENKHEYRADFSTLSEFLINLSVLKIVEEKTRISANHKKLGLAERGTGAAIRVSMMPGENSILIGNQASSIGSFVRYENEPQVFLTDDSIDVSTEWIDWVDPVVINIPMDVVNTVEIESASGAIFSGVKNEESGVFELLAMPQGRELKYPTVVDSMARLLVNIRMLDLEPYNSITFTDSSSVRFGLGSEETIVVRSIAFGGEFMMHIDRSDLSDWQFKISELTFKELNKDVEAMLKPLDSDVE